MIVGLVLTIACHERKLVVLPNQDLLIRPPAPDYANGAPGFEIVAGWEKPFSKYFDCAAGMLSWTDGHDVFVGSDFDHGVGLGLTNPPERWTSDESGIYWTTHQGELWNASRQRGARVIWRFKGAAYDLALGRSAAYLVIAPAGFPSADALARGEVEVQEIWRVPKEAGQPSLLWSTKGRLGSVIVDGEVVFTPNSADEIRRIDGPTGRHAVLSTGFGDIVGFDDRYIYGADGHAAFRAPKTGGRGEVLAQLNPHYVSEFSTRFGRAEAVFEGGQLFWMEWPGLRGAPVEGGAQILLAAMNGTDVHVVPAGDSVYVHDLGREMVYRVPRRGGASPVEIPTGEEGVATFTSNGSALFWVAGLDIRKLDRNGTDAVIVAADAKAQSALAADETDVYFTRLEGTLWRVPVSGGTPARLADLRSQAGPSIVTTAMDRTVVLRRDDVYFGSFTRGAVATIKKGGGVVRILAEGIQGPRALVVDGEFIYLVSADNKADLTCKAKLLRLPVSGGKVAELVSDVPCWADVATTRNDVYFGASHGDLFRVAKLGGKPVIVQVHGASSGAFAEPVAFAATGESLFVATADQITRLEAGKRPRVVASGLLNPASSMLITGRTMHFSDFHLSHGIPSANLYSLDLGE